MNSATSPIARLSARIERENLPNKARPRRIWRLRAVLACLANNGASDQEATFFRIEYRQASPVSRYTAARDAQLCAKCPGPPPLGL
jgi:hypothetical protein